MIELIMKIKNRSAKITVLGLGYVGLPTAAILAEAGFKVTGVDKNPKVVYRISKEWNYKADPSLIELVKNVAAKGLLTVTIDGVSAVKESDVVVVCVPTPLTRKKKPRLSYLKEACATIVRGHSKGKLIVLESTCPPRTTNGLVAPLLEASGLRAGIDFWLASCPERITPRNALQEFKENSRLIGGFNPQSAQLAAELFRTIVKGQLTITDSTTAEVAKLAENTFRDVNIAFANELALICESTGVDIMEVIKLANTHPRVNIHMPGPGVGGPCLSKDPYFLLYPAQEKNVKSRIIHEARRLNDDMPKHIVQLVKNALRKAGKRPGESRIVVMGTAYKGDVNDPRQSPARYVIEKLRAAGATVVAYDPYCVETFGAERAESLEQAMKNADVGILMTDHTIFKDLVLKDIKNLMKSNPVIVDARRLVVPRKAIEEGFGYSGIGYGSSC